MKKLIFTMAALGLAGAAIAQDPNPGTATGDTMGAGTQTLAPGQPNPAGGGPTTSTDQPTDTGMAQPGTPPASGGDMSAPGNMSSSGTTNTGDMNATTTDSGSMSSGGMNSSMTPQPSNKTYPMCSRTVRDNCMNRGAKPR